MTQMEYARAGIITPQMQHVAEVEQLPAAFIAERVAAGAIVIPANINHKNLIPCGIGRELKTKINANLSCHILPPFCDFYVLNSVNTNDSKIGFVDFLDFTFNK